MGCRTVAQCSVAVSKKGPKQTETTIFYVLSNKLAKHDFVPFSPNQGHKAICV